MATNIPVIAPVPGIRPATQHYYDRIYNNPHFDYLSEMLPKDIKEMFKWCEVGYNSMPVIANGIRKLINYPVTDFTVENASEKIRRDSLSMYDTLRLRDALLEFGNDLYVYGNAFRSVYFPFRRYLKCSHCTQETAIEEAKFRLVRNKFLLKCSCGFESQAEIVDRDIKDYSKIRIVKWDPKQIELKQNPITGSTVYYYNLPKNIMSAIRTGDVNILHDTPRIFVDAALGGTNIKLGSNFYHGKVPGLSGYSSGWGISPLMPTLKDYMYIAVLRRASEAIGMEHITPKTILFPQTSGTSDPSIMSSMKTWRNEISAALEKWRWDPNYVMTAPYPTGVTNIGSQGRSLAPTPEIKDTRQEMAMALDIPLSLIMGDMTIQNSTVGLRILENQLTPHVRQLESFAEWVIKLVNAELSKEFAIPKLVPFRLADDMLNKQMLFQMQGNGISRRTLQEALNIDPDEERDKLKQEQIEDAKFQQEVQKGIEDEQNNLAAQAQAAEQTAITGKPSPYDQQKIVAQAQEIAMQLQQMPYEQRRSALSQLQKEDLVMYSVVLVMNNMLKNQQTRQAQMQMQQQQG